MSWSSHGSKKRYSELRMSLLLTACMNAIVLASVSPNIASTTKHNRLLLISSANHSLTSRFRFHFIQLSTFDYLLGSRICWEDNFHRDCDAILASGLLESANATVSEIVLVTDHCYLIAGNFKRTM
jgi:hypothetical protein